MNYSTHIVHHIQVHLRRSLGNLDRWSICVHLGLLGIFRFFQRSVEELGHVCGLKNKQWSLSQKKKKTAILDGKGDQLECDALQQILDFYDRLYCGFPFKKLNVSYL